MNRENNNLTSSAKKLNTRIIVAVVIAVTVLLNVAVYFIPDNIRRLDMTASDSYTLSDSTKEYFSSLDEKVTLYVIDGDGSDVKYEYLLDRVDNCSKNIDVKWLGSDKATHLLEPLNITKAMVTPYLVIIESDKRSMAIPHSELVSYRTDNSTLVSFLGTDRMSVLEYEYAKQMFATQAQSGSEYASQYAAMLEMLLYDVEQYFNAEPYLCQMVEYVTVDVIPARYVLTGHGETPLDKTEAGYYLSSQLGVTHKTLDITDGKVIPEDAVSIILLDPTSDLSKSEADALIDFLNGGGQITFFTSDAALDMPNLMSVINAYGLTAEKGIVSERVSNDSDDEKVEGDTENSEKQSEGADKVEGEGQIQITDKISVIINTDHKATSDLKGISMSPKITKGNSIIFNNSDGFKLTPILTTSENAYIGDNDTDRCARSVAAVSEKDGGGTLLWFTGAGSFTAAIPENSSQSDISRVSNCMLVMSSMSLAPFTYESTLKIPEATFYGERLMSATETGFVAYVIVISVLVAVLAVFGIIFIYKRKKA